ncbi:hypothetical protein C8J57DRAFT_1674949 [Mycena rebaudengoi]|nr:hypothetical protein C8J57DRAFT_1674949 [Mycena rebaudengoi]
MLLSLPHLRTNQTDMDPNLTRLICSNQAPTCAERFQIESGIRSSDVALAEIDEQILKLKSQRESISILRAAMQVVLSPVRRLPPEILAEIFLLCRDNDLLGWRRYSVLDPRQAPLLLGQICSHWRVVSQTTPCLWDQIHIQGAIPAIREPSGHLAAFATRARNRPLHLVINTRSYYGTGTSSDTWPLDIALHLRHKLQRLHLTLNWNEYQSSGLPVGNSFPVLSSLFIDIYDSLHLQQPELIRLVRSFGTLPTLQSLTLHAPDTSGDRLLSAVPWSQLTSLDLRVEMKVMIAQQLVLQAQKLQTLVITGIKFTADVPRILPIRVFPEMRSIKYSTRSYPTIAAFFLPFSFPNLKSFNIDASEESQHILRDIHAQSGFQLEKLELYGLKIETDGLISFLRLQPSLVYLSLTYCKCVDNNLFTSFTYDPLFATPPISLPLLQILKINQSADSLRGDLVVDMVGSLSAPTEDRPAGHPFPRLTRIDLKLDGLRFGSYVESRLETLSATGFLHDNSERCDPYDSDKSYFWDWYVSLEHFSSTLIFFLVVELNL